MTNVNALYDDLAHIDAMKEHLLIQQQQYTETTGKASESQRGVWKCRDKLDGLNRQLKAQGDNKEQWLVQQVAEVEDEYDRLAQEAEQLLRRQQELNEEILLQEHAIANNHLLNHVTLKGVLEHQENISQAAAEVERINQLIQDQTPLINALTTAELPLNSLLEQKEDILADMAAGTRSEKELDEVNQQIEQVQVNIKQAREKADRAEAAKIGLKRKLEEAKQALAGLKDKTQGVRECLLHALAEEEGQHYFKIADQLQRSYVRLMGLHALIQQQSPKRIGICMDKRELRIPGFKLGSAGQYMNEKETWFFDWDKQFGYGHSEQESMTVELKKLKNAGVTII
ncbi:MAG: hypothetical protein ACXW0Q_09645 [Methylovulum sp.]